MLVKILGCIWITAAILLLLKPQAYKNWLQKNMSKRHLLLLPLIAGVLLIYIGLKFQGLLANIVVILGGMSLLKAALFLNTKVYSKLMDWAMTLPFIYYRIGACIHIGIGLVLLLLR